MLSHWQEVELLPGLPFLPYACSPIDPKREINLKASKPYSDISTGGHGFGSYVREEGGWYRVGDASKCMRFSAITKALSFRGGALSFSPSGVREESLFTAYSAVNA